MVEEGKNMTERSVVGKSVPRLDALEKVTGKAKYSVDMKFPGMLYGKVLRSPHPHARISRIDTSGAEKLAKIKGVVTGKDAPDERVGHIRDRYILARDTVRFIGEAVAAVAAETIEAAEEALESIKVEYEILPAVFDAEEAMRPHSPVVVHPDLSKYTQSPLPYPLYRFVPGRPNVYVHRPIRKGDTEKGFEASDLVFENRFSTPMAQHSCLELHNALAVPEPDGGLTVYDSTHVMHMHKADLCRLFRLPPSKVRVVSLYIGGCFGGKAGMIVPGIASLLALKTRRPVQLVLSRDEVFLDGTSRESMTIYIKDGVRKDGALLAREMRMILNAGAYSGTTALVTKNATFGAVGTYRVPNFKLDSYSVATHTPATGAFRGFGSTEVLWAIESQMDMIAEELGIDPLEIRRINLLKEGEEDVLGMRTHSTGARECLEKVAGWIEWNKAPSGEEGPWKRGKGIAVGNKYTMPATRSVVNVKVHQDAAIEVRHSAHEVGQGCNTALAQIAAEEFGASVDKIRIVFTDTAVTPFDAGTISSRSTFHTGNALRLACQDAKRRIFDLASDRVGARPEELSLRDGVISVKGNNKTMKVAELFAPVGFLLKGGELVGTGTFVGPLEPEDADTGQGKRPVTYYAHGANAVEVMVNVETGEVRVVRNGTSFDMGQPINPKLCEAQMEGGLGMGIGGALYEEMALERGEVVNSSFMDYKCPTSLDMPSCKDVKSMIAAAPHQEGPYGAKGFSEGGLVAVAPAIGNAIYKATGVRIRDLPITKEKVLKMLRALGVKKGLK
jgi:CO/xanthine dehydrogenase Mo-binding subunit